MKAKLAKLSEELDAVTRRETERQYQVWLMPRVCLCVSVCVYVEVSFVSAHMRCVCVAVP